MATQIREVLTRIVVANYFGKGNIAEVGWLYASVLFLTLRYNAADFTLNR
jgi:hypothetical protein